jgi:alkaline phosphatase D
MNCTFLALIVCFVSLTSWAQVPNSQKLNQIKKLNRLAFASCNKHLRAQPIWKQIANEIPDLFIWGGDNVYADGKGVTEILNAYNIQNSSEEYKAFKNVTPIVGTWDDHDYGKNNGGHEYEFKDLSKKYALDFFEEPQNSPRRTNPGIQTSYIFGEGLEKVKIILLDNRYFKDETKGALLGEYQWNWLAQELQDPSISLFLIVSGISVLTPKTIHSEEWADYPRERERLQKLLKATKKPYLYLAGDRHFSDIFTRGDELEFLSSGMTHNTERIVRPMLRMQYPAPIFKHNFGLIDFLWENGTPILKMSIRTVDGQSYNMTTAKWNKTTWEIKPQLNALR